MQRLLALCLGLLAAVMGYALHLPTHKRWYAVQIALNEYPWLAGVVGGLATLAGLWKWRSPLGALFGLAGVWLMLPPLREYRRITSRLRQAMFIGLGVDYDYRIPKPARARMARSRYSLRRALGLERLSDRVCRVHDIEYATVDGQSLKLDAYLPKIPPAMGDHYPAIIVVHGGSWNGGKKGEYFAPHHHRLAAQGYAVFDIEYRLSTVAHYPAQIDDIHRAIRWVRANADTYHIDPDRVALYGRSAGGHLALLAAYCPADEETVVSGVVAVYPVTELRLWDAAPRPTVVQLLGGRYHEIPDLYAQASPTTYARDDLPPTLLIHGYRDSLARAEHSELLYNLLLPTNTPTVFLRLPWARHGYDAAANGMGQQMTEYDIDRFLGWCFYRQKD
jgi:acetyl esterase/lipase